MIIYSEVVLKMLELHYVIYCYYVICQTVKQNARDIITTDLRLPSNERCWCTTVRVDAQEARSGLESLAGHENPVLDWHDQYIPEQQK